MGKYTVIADIGSSLVQLLRDNLCPDVIMSPDNIGLCSPADKGDMILGLIFTMCGRARSCGERKW